MKRGVPGLCLGGFLLLLGCRSVESPKESQSAKPAPAAKPAKPPKQTANPKPTEDYVPSAVLYNPLYDPEIKDILALSKKGEWE